MADYLTLNELVARYRGTISKGTFNNYRSKGYGGPAWVKLGGKIMYRLADVEEWERSQRREQKVRANERA